jgi:hypothetical protein
MLRVEDYMGNVDRGFSLSLSLELLTQLKETILNLILDGRIKLLLPTD